MGEEIENNNQELVGDKTGLLAYFAVNEIVIFSIFWLYTVCAFLSKTSFFKALGIILLFTILAPILIKLANVIRMIFTPEIIVADSALGTIAKKTFWVIGPQVIATILAISFAAQIVGVRL